MLAGIKLQLPHCTSRMFASREFVARKCLRRCDIGQGGQVQREMSKPVQMNARAIADGQFQRITAV